MASVRTRTSFSKLGLSDLNTVNDAQKEIFRAQAAEFGGEDFLNARAEAYLFRWKEALAFTGNGVQILDIGGGWMREDIFALVTRQHGLNYHMIDISEQAVAGARQKLVGAGMDERQAVVSDNTYIPFRNQSFDFVFSSHCLEHSVDLGNTFAEIRRVLKPGGSLFLSVPFGFDESNEHNYCLGLEEWSLLVEAAGFRVVNVNVGRNYTYAGWDLSIFATMSGLEEPDRFAKLTTVFCKSEKILIHHTDPSFDFGQSVVTRAHGASMHGVGAQCILDIPNQPAALLVYRNAWSGVIEIQSRDVVRYVDAYSLVDWLAAVDLSGMAAPIRIKVVGGHPSAHGIQGGIFGVLASPDIGDAGESVGA